jgi:hypothetical protein
VHQLTDNGNAAQRKAQAKSLLRYDAGTDNIHKHDNWRDSIVL